MVPPADRRALADRCFRPVARLASVQRCKSQECALSRDRVERWTKRVGLLRGLEELPRHEQGPRNTRSNRRVVPLAAVVCGTLIRTQVVTVCTDVGGEHPDAGFQGGSRVEIPYSGAPAGRRHRVTRGPQRPCIDRLSPKEAGVGIESGEEQLRVVDRDGVLAGPRIEIDRRALTVCDGEALQQVDRPVVVDRDLAGGAKVVSAPLPRPELLPVRVESLEPDVIGTERRRRRESP